MTSRGCAYCGLPVPSGRPGATTCVSHDDLPELELAYFEGVPAGPPELEGVPVGVPGWARPRDRSGRFLSMHRDVVASGATVHEP